MPSIAFARRAIAIATRVSGSSRERPVNASIRSIRYVIELMWMPSARAAARVLGIHINSMTYRVERIEALTGLSLDDAETRVAIAIALRARAMLGL